MKKATANTPEYLPEAIDNCIPHPSEVDLTGCEYLKGAKFSYDEHHDYKTVVATFTSLHKAEKFSRVRLSRPWIMVERETIRKSKAKRKPKVWVVRYKPAEYNLLWRFDASDVLTELDDMMQ